MKAQPSLVTMVPSISVNQVFLEVFRPKSGCLSEKRDFFGQSGANPASNWILAQPQQAQVESNGKSIPESIDQGMAEIQAIQFRGCKMRNTGKAYHRN